tara:strand:+ start:1417 stop:1704 length:288 start_codon:yes stop_codon:yes gene_type:complete
MENWTEIGFAGLSATILFMTFKWMTSELNKKIDDLQDIVIKLIDAKNNLKEAISDHELKMLDEFKSMADNTTDQLNYIESKLGNGRGSKQRRRSN